MHIALVGNQVVLHFIVRRLENLPREVQSGSAVFCSPFCLWLATSLAYQRQAELGFQMQVLRFK